MLLFFDERTLAFGDQGVQQGGQPIGKQLGKQLLKAMNETAGSLLPAWRPLSLEAR
jgi:hypothetical protein